MNAFFLNKFLFFIAKTTFSIAKMDIMVIEKSNLHSVIAILAIKNSLFGNHERLTFK